MTTDFPTFRGLSCRPGIAIVLLLHCAYLSASSHLPDETTGCQGCMIKTRDTTYLIESIESQVIFKLNSLAAFNISGIADSPKGYISYNPGKLEDSRVSVLIKSSNIKLNNSIYDSILKGRRFLDSERYPNIIFISKSIEMLDDINMKIYGRLTIRGVSRDEVLTARLTKNMNRNDEIRFIASTSIKRSDYGMKSMMFLLSNQVDLQIEVSGIPLLENAGL